MQKQQRAKAGIKPPESTTLFIEKFAEGPIGAAEELVALKSAQAFAKAEFGTEAEVIRDEETIPNTRAPYHVRLRLRVDAANGVHRTRCSRLYR